MMSKRENQIQKSISPKYGDTKNNQYVWYCSSCGAKNDNGNMFCVQCGKNK